MPTSTANTNTSGAFLDDSKLTSKGNVIVEASDTSKITAKVIAASFAAAVGGTAGVGASIGVGLARNQIGWGAGTDNAFNYTSGQQLSSLAVGQRVKIASGPRSGDIYEFIGTPVSGETIQLWAQDYGDSEIWRQVNQAKSAIQVQAYTRNTRIDADGSLSLSAIANQTIDALTVAGSVAISGGGTVGVGLSGAGVSAENKIAANVKAFIEGDGDTGIEASSLSLTAKDTSVITTDVAAASIAASVAGVGAVSVSIAVSLARNEISNTVESYISNAGDVSATGGNIKVSAEEHATIQALSVAASVAVGVGVSAFGLALSGAGAEGTNIINNRVAAHIDNSSVVALSNIVVDAKSTSVIEAVVGAVSAAVGGGLVGLAGSIGVSLARNLIGYDSVSDTTGGGNQVLAYSLDSNLTSSGAVRVTASATDTIEKAVSFAGSAAISGGLVAVSLAAAGAEATNHIGTTAKAYLSGSNVRAVGDIEVEAVSGTQIKRTDAIGASLSVAIGIGGAASVAVSLIDNLIANDVQAYIDGTSARPIQAGGDVSVVANVSKAWIKEVSAVTASISGGLVGFSGGGVNIDNLIDNNVSARIGGPFDSAGARRCDS